MENPLLLLFFVAICWPGIIPMIVVFWLARSFDLRISRRNYGPVTFDTDGTHEDTNYKID